MRQSGCTVERDGLLGAVEHAADGIVITDTNGKIQYVNPAFTALTGYSCEESVGQTPGFLRSGRHSDAFYQALWHTILSGGVWQGEITNRRKDGTFYEEEMRIAPVKDPDGAITGYIAIKHDVTSRRANEDAQAFLAAIVQGSHDAIIAYSPVGTILTWNRGAAALLGYSAEEAIGQPTSMLVPPERLPNLASLTQHVLQGNHETRYTAMGLQKDGRIVHVFITASPIRNSAGEVTAIALLIRDMTEHRKSEQRVRESEERFRTMADSCPSLMWVTSPNGETEFINREYRRFCGLIVEQAQQGDWQSLLHPDDAPGYVEAFQNAVAEHTRFSAEVRVRRADGAWRLVGTNAEPRLSAVGEYMGHIGLSADITERKQAEQALRGSEEKFRQLAENIREVFRIIPIAVDETLYVSPAFEEIWGRTMESIYRDPESWREAVHPDDRGQADHMAEHQMLGEPVEVEYRIQTPDGQRKWIRDRAFPVRDQSGELIRIAGIAEDISERKRAEQDILASHEFVQSTIDALSSSMCVLDETGTIIEVNRTWKDFALANRKVHVHECSDFGQLEDKFGAGASYLDACDRAVGNGAVEAEEFAAGIRSLLRGDVEEFSKEYACHAPHERRWFVAKVTRFFHRGLPRIVVEHVNITTRKLAEEAMRMAKLEAEAEGARANSLAREAERANAAKSEFLAKMSHEIRTPMNGVLGMTGLLLDTELTAEQRRYAELARGSGESLLQLINDILDFSKIEAKKLELETIDFDLRVLLDNLASILSATAQAKGIELLCRTDPAVPSALRGDPGRLRQVLTNLAGNAIKFTDHGEVVVRVELTEEGESDSVLRFSVRDTGIGIGKDKIGVLFEKFSQVEVSTTRKYGGTGLGLAISKQLVEMMGGHVGVMSEEGRGSEFWFTVRLGRSREMEAKAKGAHPEAQTNAPLNGRILVAEDNSTNREVALGILRKLGLRADAVSNGAEAIKALESIPYDLVLMDMRMPVMDGLEASRQIRNPRSAVLHHDIPIVALTANAMECDRRSCLAAGMNDFVPKPILKGVLRDVLGKWLPTPVSANPPAASQLPPVKAKERDKEIFDLAGVLSRLEGDNELAQTVLDTFLTDIPHQIEALNEFVECGDDAGAARQAHSIKGASASVGGESLRKLAAQMEKAADAGDWHTVINHMDELELQFSLLKNAIEENGSLYAK